MRFEQLEIEGVYLIELAPHEDQRGYFARTFCEKTFADAGLWCKFPQHNISFNKNAGTVRGMHFQVEPHEEVKVVRCQSGSIDDIVVDLRPSSASYKKHLRVELSAENNLGLYIPTGLAHGFQTLKDNSIVSYLMGREFHPESSAGFRWNDPGFNIQWRREISVISERDQNYSDFSF